VRHSRRNVADAFAKWRKQNRHDLQPIEKVVAETSRLDLVLEVAIGGATTRTSTRMSASPPTRLNRSVLEETQQLCLKAGVISPISSRNTVPPSAVSSKPALLLSRVGEGAALVTEQLALEELLGQRRAGDVDERLRRASLL
jgi:hypothetical protein